MWGSAILRLGLSLAGASLLGLPTVLFFWLGTQGQAPVTGSVNPGVAIGTGVFVLGIAAWFGGELAFRTQPSAPSDRRRFLVWLGALVVACTLYGAVIGVLTVGLVVGAWVGGIVWLTLGATGITRFRARRTLPHGG